MMLQKNKKLVAMGGALLLGLVSCQGSLSPTEIGNSPSIASEQTKNQNALKPSLTSVRFQVSLDSLKTFGLKQTAQAQVVKLEITNGSQTFFANNVDENGFAYATSGNSSIALSANVPDNDVFSVKLGFYSNASPEAQILELRSAFTTPTTGTVSIDQRTTVTGGLLYELQKQSPEYVENLDLNALQGFVDGFLGLDNGTFTHLGASTSFMPRSPQDVAFPELAFALYTGLIGTLSFESGNTASTSGLYRYRKMPYDLSALPIAQVLYSEGIRAAMAVATNGPLSTTAILTHPFDRHFIGASLKHDEVSGKVNGNSEILFDIDNLRTIQSPTVSTGYANQNGTSVPVFYFIDDSSTFLDPDNQERIVARSQIDGSIVWSYDFDQTPSRTTTFTPVVQSSIDPDCSCKADYVYVAHNAKTVGKPNVFKIRSRTVPEVVASYVYDGSKAFPTYFDGSGALSPDGTKLYLVHGKSRTAADLVILNTSDLTKIKILDLSPYGVYPTSTYPASSSLSTSSPVVAADGTVYLSTFSYASNNYAGSYLQAITGDTGLLKWTTPFALTTDSSSRPRYSPVIETVNGVNHVYVTTSTGQSDSGNLMHAVKDTGTVAERLWQKELPFDANFSLDPALLESERGETLIVTGSAGNGKIYFLDAENGDVVDSLYQGGHYTAGFAAFDKTIFFNSYNVNKTYLRAFQYPVKGFLPPDRSSWPRAGGAMSNSGAPSQVLNE